MEEGRGSHGGLVVSPGRLDGRLAFRLALVAARETRLPRPELVRPGRRHGPALRPALRQHRDAVLSSFGRCRGVLQVERIIVLCADQAHGAAESYRELVKLEPDNADFHNNFGILLVRSGNVGPAIVQFETALKANPAHDAARRNLELARKKLSQH